MACLEAWKIRFVLWIEMRLAVEERQAGDGKLVGILKRLKQVEKWLI